MIVLPIAYVITSKVRRVGYYAILISTVFFLAILLAFLKWYAPANVWMECYYKARLVLTMNNVGNTTEDHFEIIGRFFSELIVCLACVVILCAYLKFKKNYPLRFIAKNFVSNKLALSLLLTAFAGSFPYALSLVQRGFYLIPAFICFVLAIVYGLRRYWMFFFLFTGKIAGFKFTRILFPFIASASLIYFCFSFTLYKRNEQLLKDIDMILPYLKKGEIVLIEGERWNDFSLHSYLYMAKQVSLSMNKKECKFLIRSKSAPEQNTTTFAKLELKSGEIDLYVLKE